MSATIPALRCRDLTVEIDGHHLLHDVAIDVASGEWVSVLGPNGAGKTTLLRAISGVVPARGSIELFGAPAGALHSRERARRVALVPQVPVIPAGMRVLDYVILGRTPHIPLFGTESRADLEAAAHAMNVLHLDEFATRSVESLSGGERQRVLLARALAQGSPLLLLDEPTASLDIGHQQEVLELVDGLRKERAMTVVTTMHDLTLAGQYADRLVLLRAGRVVLEGTAAEVITAQHLSCYYGANVEVIDVPGGGRVIVPMRSNLRAATEGAP